MCSTILPTFSFLIMLRSLPDLLKEVNSQIIEHPSSAINAAIPRRQFDLVEIYKLIAAFSNDFVGQLNGASEHKDPYENNVIEELEFNRRIFKEAVLSHGPKFVPFTKAELITQHEWQKHDRGHLRRNIDEVAQLLHG